MSLVTMTPCSLHLSGLSCFILCWPTKIKTKSVPYLCLSDGCGVCVAIWTSGFASRSICGGDRPFHDRVKCHPTQKYLLCLCALFWYLGLPWGTERLLKAGGAPAGPMCVLYHLAENTDFSVPSPRTSLFYPAMAFYKRHINSPPRRMP